MAIYTMATLPEITKYVFELNILPRLHDFGDLYNLSFLHSFKRFNPPCSYSPPRFPNHKKKITLFLIGDSFTEHMVDSNFIADSYQYIHWEDQLRTSLDTSHYNVLIIESVERELKRFQGKCNNLVIKGGLDKSVYVHRYEQTFTDKLTEYIFGRGIIESNLELIAFDNSICNKMKEIKAGLNYSLFSRLAPSVVISNNGKMLYYKATVDSSSPESSFVKLPEATINRRVIGMNNLSKRYAVEGFNLIIFSIIPNKVSVLDSNLYSYNHQIERIQNNPELNVNYVNAYHLLQQLGGNGYYYNDTHWSCEGRYAWLDSINEDILKAYNYR